MGLVVVGEGGVRNGQARIKSKWDYVACASFKNIKKKRK